MMVILTGFALAAQDEMEQTAPPMITVEDYGSYVTFVFTCDDDVNELNAYFYCNGDFVDFREGYFPWLGGAKSLSSEYRMNRTYEEQNIDIVAQARAEGKDYSETVQFNYVITPLQISEKTSTPIIELRHEAALPDGSTDQYYYYCAVAFGNTDESEVVLYYRYNYIKDWETGGSGTEVTSDWKTVNLLSYDYPYMTGIVDPDLLIEDSAIGWVEIYAQAEHKLPSDTVREDFFFECYPSQHFQRDFDFIVDNIYYKILDDSSVAVSKRTVDKTVHFDPIQGAVVLDSAYDNEEPNWGEGEIGDVIWGSMNPCYFDDVVIPETVDYNGKTYTVTAIKDYAFEGCQLTSIQLPSTLTSIGLCAFYCSFIPEITIPGSVTEIGDGAFASCNSLTSVEIPESVISIGDGVFSYCEFLTNVSLPESITSIGSGAFGYCYSLNSIEIPNAVTVIGNRAFRYCSELTSVTIPSSVTEIGTDAFSYCTNLNSVTCQAIVPPDIEYVFYSADHYLGSCYIYENATLYVPYESIMDYTNHWEWGLFSHIVPLNWAGPGDINGDGVIAVNDAINLIDQLLDGADVPAYCDVDGDGTVSIKDITTLIDALLSGN